MNLIRQHRPSQGTAIALAALFVALGGVAFAAIPDSNGIVHACYQRSSGNLRVVESSANCRTSENALELRAGASVGGSGIVARARTTGPTPVSLSQPAIPLSGGTWTQGQHDTNEFLVEATLTIPSGNCALFQVDVYADGERVVSLGFGGGGNSGQFVKRSSGFLLDPQTATQRTLTAKFSFPLNFLNCDDATLDTLRVNVAARS